MSSPVPSHKSGVPDQHSPQESLLRHFDSHEVVSRGDGIETVRLSDPPLPGQSFIKGITSFPPGTGLARHSHNTVEQVTVLEGNGIVELNGQEHPIAQYDCTLVPADEPHRFENTGQTIMRILWVYGSTEVTRTFTATGETVPNHGLPTMMDRPQSDVVENG